MNHNANRPPVSTTDVVKPYREPSVNCQLVLMAMVILIPFLFGDSPPNLIANTQPHPLPSYCQRGSSFAAVYLAGETRDKREQKAVGGAGSFCRSVFC